MHRRTTLISSPEHSAKTKNREYWQEVQTLIGFLNQQKRIKAINEAIHVSGTGVWSVTPGKIDLPGGTAIPAAIHEGCS